MRSYARFAALALIALFSILIAACATRSNTSASTDQIETLATEKYIFWTGDTADGHTKPQPLNGCHDAHVVAQGICTLNQPGGQKTPYTYSFRHISTSSGGRCGYSQYETGCIGMPSVSGTRKQSFSFGEGGNYGCGTDTFHVGRNFCSVHGPNATRYPFTMRVTRTVDGGRCGLTTIEYACRSPFPTQFSESQVKPMGGGSQ